jgi:hypothetical protein
MKIYLDDERPAPQGWVRCYWPEEVIALLAKENVTEISLDHDLGDWTNTPERTGYDVLGWLEREVHDSGYQSRPFPKIHVHSANPVAKKRMKAAITAILKALQSYP